MAQDQPAQMKDGPGDATVIESRRAKMNKNLLQTTLATADKLSMNLTDGAIVRKLIPHFLLKFDLSDEELRKIFKFALHDYRTQSNIALEKVGLLNAEERFEVLTRLRHTMQAILEPLFNNDEEITRDLNLCFDAFFDQYIPHLI